MIESVVLQSMAMTDIMFCAIPRLTSSSESTFSTNGMELLRNLSLVSNAVVLFEQEIVWNHGA